MVYANFTATSYSSRYPIQEIESDETRTDFAQNPLFFVYVCVYVRVCERLLMGRRDDGVCESRAPAD